MRICGPKLSLCGLIISAWGIVQLALMGVFYFVRSVALAEDLSVMDENFETAEEFISKAEQGYTQNAYNCWIAACLYVLTLLFSGHQFYMNSRSALAA